MRGAAAGVLVLAVVVGCTPGTDRPVADEAASATRPLQTPSAGPGAGTLAALDPASSLTPAGRSLAGRVDWTTRPAYDVRARIEPTTGDVTGRWTAVLPVGEDADELRLRWFPGLDDLDTGAQLARMRVDGTPVEPLVDESLAVVGLPEGHGASVRLDAEFAYQVRELTTDSDLLGGLLDDAGLQPSDVGLLGRHADGLSLGHWFPLWIPAGGSATPVPEGFGDLGNFPAGSIRVQADVPAGWEVVGGGVPVEGGEAADEGRRVVVEEGLGLRDLSLAVLRDVTVRERTVAGTTLRVTGPATVNAATAAVLDESVESLRALSAAFGPYPWSQLDVTAVPLGSGVGGMEWPGAIWLESTLFGGGVPGLEGFGDLGELGELLGGRGGDVFGDGPLGAALDPASLQALRRWTVAHEVAHQWWHALVGNDSLLSPAVDEPLAQYSACVAMRGSRATRADADTICEGQTAGTYAQMRLLGEPDGAVARPSDEFDSALQYGGLVYGKAPGLYLALEEVHGPDAAHSALRGVAADFAFELLEPGQLGRELGARLGDPAGVRTLSDRWLIGTFGDEDLGVDADAGLGSLLEDLAGGQLSTQ